MIWVEFAILAVLLITLYWLGAIFFAIQKGFGEVIEGLESIDDRLRHLQEKK